MKLLVIGLNWNLQKNLLKQSQFVKVILKHIQGMKKKQEVQKVEKV